MNKKYVYICSIIVLFLTLFLVFSLSHKGTNARTRKIFYIAGDINFPPYEFVDEDGVYRGFNVDMIRAIAIEMGIDIKIMPMKWKDAVQALEEGQVDAIQGMLRSAKREEIFRFSDPIIINSQVIFVRKDNQYIAEIKDLRGSKVVVQKGDISEEILQQLGNVGVFLAETQYEALEALIRGEVDAFVGNRLTGLYILQKYKYTDQIKIVGNEMNTSQYCIAVQKDNIQLMELFNQGLGNLKQNKTYDKIYYKWFGEEIQDHTSMLRRFLIVCMMAFVGTSVITIVMIWLNRRLKKLVERRTEELRIINEELKNEIEERKKAQEETWYQAHYDYLTNIANRKYFMDALKEAIIEAEGTDYKIGVLFLDLDKFKLVNDTFGHEFGDQLLHAFVERVKACITEDCFFSRNGGDEFTIMCTHVTQIYEIMDIADQIIRVLQVPFMIEQQSVNQNASIGISIYPDHGRDIESLLKIADRDMYYIKCNGGNGCKISEI